MHEIQHGREISPLKDLRCYGTQGLIRDLKPDIVTPTAARRAYWGVLPRGRRPAICRAGAKLGVVHTIHGPPFLVSPRHSNAIYIASERLPPDVVTTASCRWRTR